MSTNVSDYDFELPNELIAQHPLLDRTSSKLLVLDPKTGLISDESFNDITKYLTSNDVLVLNNTRVIPARLFGVKEKTGAKIEFLLLNEKTPDLWNVLVKPAKRIAIGDQVNFGEGTLICTCTNILEDGIREFKMQYSGIYLEVLDKLGTMPLPPYITEQLDDQDRYQTVYSKDPGSVAAPTAGLHFTDELLSKIKDIGVEILYVTLHVGLGTFRPVSADNVLDHKMHSEEYYIDEITADKLNEYKKSNKRIIAVGTTTTRTLESNFNKHNKFVSDHDNTEIFIYPGYKFNAIDALITNFHLPKSTLMMLISALTNREMILDTYKHAIDHEYRFFSFGDSMFINKDLD